MEGSSDMRSFNRRLPRSPSSDTPKINDPPAMNDNEDDDLSSEISIFDAHKYYKERMAPVAEPHCQSPTAWSEASWGSQTELLWNSPTGVTNMNMRSITREKRRMWTSKLFFGMICGCWGKKKKMKAIDNRKNEKLSENHDLLPGPDSKRQTDRHGYEYDDIDLIPKFPTPETHFTSTPSSETGFSFPILCQPPPAKLVFTAARNPIPLEEPPRDSLEVFLPPELFISPKSADVISLQIFAPDSGARDRRSFTLSASPKSWGAAMDDGGEGDVTSDGSSDLFDIEISTTNCSVYHRRDEYEPSEASIEWSVTTAEGADRGSVLNFPLSAADVCDANETAATATWKWRLRR